MRCIYFFVFLTFSSCFLALPALENVTQADDIELLERKLEYLKAKKELDLELKIVKAKLQKLNQDYSDVVDTKTAVSASSTSETPETEKFDEIVEVDPDPIGRTWDATELKGRCVDRHGNKLTESTIQVNADSSFSYKVTNREGWKGTFKGNLEDKKLKLTKAKNNAFLKDYEILKDGEQWVIEMTLGWSGGGCSFSFRLE